MKAKDLLLTNGELAHKLRTEKDLIRHIKTREDEASNYALLLGAGASVTSGIKSAGNLVDQWLVELYERFNREECADVEIIKQYFETYHSSWYNPGNAYSSLFEKKYDLPSQRRRFVEMEVDGRLPSIGYAYLTKLVDNSFFNTIFTTNFDDLISESFYQFSSRRPIVCAHDSSIHSVSITSKRPKIIKLHGDYLFDDIKSTVRETESLEQNIKDKLVEFCKDLGLVVLGYSGSDRSVMDVLDFLSKQEFHIKNGIYWCLREEDEISQPLRNLLWKDRVYPVLIEGFDEFMAKSFSDLVGRKLDIESNIKHSKLQKTVRSILKDEYQLSKKSTLINSELTDIKNSRDRVDVSDFLYDRRKSNDEAALSMADTRNLMEIESVIDKEDYDTANRICEEYLACAESSTARSAYMRTLVKICSAADNLKGAVRWVDQLLSEDYYQSTLHLLKAAHLQSDKEKFEYLIDIKKKFPYSSSILNSLASYAAKNKRSNKEFSQNYEQILEFLDESLKLDPSLENPALSQKLNILTSYKKEDKSKEDYCNEEIEKLLLSCDSINPTHLQALRLRTKYYSERGITDKIVDHLDNMLELRTKSSIDKKRQIDIIISELANKCCEIPDKELDERLKKFFIESYIDESKSPIEFILSKARYLLGRERNLDAAKKLFELAIEREDCHEEFESIIYIAKAFNNFDLSRLEKSLKPLRRSRHKESYHSCIAEYHRLCGDFDRALRSIDDSFSSGLSLISYLTNKSYLLLLKEDYPEIISLHERYREKIDLNDCEAFVINLNYAFKKVDPSKFQKVTIQNLSGGARDDEVRACAFSLLENHQMSINLYKTAIEKDYMNYYVWHEWPALDRSIKEKVESVTNILNRSGS